mmetsp:Transcript_12183/g.28900  ORF Transcript_12183/g.28900 Transcript_12183/m.28900 type:complete len:400 (-) Transcript_12183:183-1382(-)
MCPFESQEIVTAEFALSRCPFLARVKSEQGDAFARRFVRQPFSPVQNFPSVESVENVDISDSQALSLFHGPSGLFPLPRFSGQPENLDALGKHEFSAESPSVPATRRDILFHLGLLQKDNAQRAVGSLGDSLLASIALGGFWFPFGGNRGVRNSKNKPGTRGGNKRSSGNVRSSSNTGSAGHLSSSTGSKSSSAGGRCPLRGLLPLLSGLMSAGSKCPAPICAVRGAVAKLKPVRQLRPQSLPVKLLAVGVFTSTLNIPCGAWRENFEKFSPGWFVAVHITIPVVGMLRKAVSMPPAAMLMTIAAAVAGQQIGAKLEAYRRARHSMFTTFSPEMAASYGCCPILPSLRETPSNPSFAIELQRDSFSWDTARRVSKPVVVGLSCRSPLQTCPLSMGIASA